MKGKIDFYSKLTICIVGILGFGYFFLKPILLLALPFLIAWAVAFVVRRPARLVGTRLRIPERRVRMLMSLLLCSSLLVLVFVFIWRLLVQGWKIISTLGEEGRLESFVSRLMNPESMLSRFLPEGISEAIAKALSGASDRLISAFADFAAGFVAGVPTVFLFIIVTLIAGVYFALDLERINSFVEKKLPPSAFGALVRFKDGFLSVGFGYLRAYFLLMLITFFLVFVGLLLLGAEYALLAAALIAVLDVLPIIGIGTVLIPWGIFQIVYGSRAFGIGLLILFAAVEFIRQLVEPKIVGKRLGLHPIASLALLYGAYSLFGILGILFVPCFVVIIKSLLGKNNSSKVEKRAVKKADKAKPDTQES